MAKSKIANVVLLHMALERASTCVASHGPRTGHVRHRIPAWCHHAWGYGESLGDTRTSVRRAMPCIVDRTVQNSGLCAQGTTGFLWVYCGPNPGSAVGARPNVLHSPPCTANAVWTEGFISDMASAHQVRSGWIMGNRREEGRNTVLMLRRRTAHS